MAADSMPGPVGSGVFGAVLDLEPYMDRLADKIAERLDQRRGRMVNQRESELGARKHREAVKRRLDNGEGGAGLSGRNYLLTREAVREELARGKGGKGGKGGSGASGAPAPMRPAGDGPPSSGSTGSKSRSHDLSDFERELMGGLRAVRSR